MALFRKESIDYVRSFESFGQVKIAAKMKRLWLFYSPLLLIGLYLLTAELFPMLALY